MKDKYEPRHMQDEPDKQEEEMSRGSVHPAAVPLPDSGEGAQYIPLPDGTNVAANGAIVRNPWSNMPEIKPDNEYTEEKEDLNLLIM